MKTLITIIEYPSMPGRFKVTKTGPDGKKTHVGDSRCPGDAAAMALNCATAHNYAIVGADKVLFQIPSDLRFKA